MNNNKSSIEEKLDYKFKDRSLLEKALTHPSIRASKQRSQNEETYERLEFLGDSVISFVISEKLYKDFTQYSEGQLSKLKMFLVCGDTMAKIANRLNLGSFIIMDNGEEMIGGRDNPKNLENVLESICAAIYLDSNEYNIIKKIILNLWADLINEDSLILHDPKTTLQEVLYAKFQKTPKYELISSIGAAHDLSFQINVIVDGLESSFGEGKTRKAAEKVAAINMLKQLKIIE
jgi:ribonuclease III